MVHERPLGGEITTATAAVNAPTTIPGSAPSLGPALRGVYDNEFSGGRGPWGATAARLPNRPWADQQGDCSPVGRGQVAEVGAAVGPSSRKAERGGATMATRRGGCRSRRGVACPPRAPSPPPPRSQSSAPPPPRRAPPLRRAPSPRRAPPPPPGGRGCARGSTGPTLLRRSPSIRRGRSPGRRARTRRASRLPVEPGAFRFGHPVCQSVIIAS